MWRQYAVVHEVLRMKKKKKKKKKKPDLVPLFFMTGQSKTQRKTNKQFRSSQVSKKAG